MIDNHTNQTNSLKTTTSLSPYEKWVHYVETQTAEKIVSLYHIESLLLPTFSETILKTQEARLNYFTQLKQQPVHISTQIQEEFLLEKNILICSGHYTFHVQNHEKKVDHSARFTFVFKKDHPKANWLIRVHQSSLA